MNILFTLCGRAGSKGFKNKNLKEFLGIPLVYYGLAAIDLWIQKSDAKENTVDVVMNTDSRELAELVINQQKVSVDIIHRDALLGGDTVPKVSVIKDCLVRMEKRKDIKYDMVVDLDITSPLRTLKDINDAIQKKVDRNDTDVVFSVTDSRRNPLFNMVKEENGYYGTAIKSEYTARQQAPIFYDMNASIYVYSVQALLHKEEKTFFNNRCDVVIMKDTAVLDIDSEEDFQLMQVIAKFLFETDKDFRLIYETAKGF